MNVVTGAFGYIGRYITRQLLDAGGSVRTVTTHPDKPNPFGRAVEARPLAFDRPEELTDALRGAATLFNTYWVRFEHGGVTFAQAVCNTATLFECAQRAGVAKVVHVSVSNASLDSPLPYYRGKAQQERALVESGLPYTILRPTLVFGRGDLLVNNIAWLIRRFPVFPIFGDGLHRLQPVYAGDLAALAAACARDSGPVGATCDAIGPEAFTFEQFVRLIAARVKPGARLVHVPPALGIGLGRVLGPGLDDVLLTRDELRGLMMEMLTSTQRPNGAVRFSEWVAQDGAELGQEYRSELRRHFHWRPERAADPTAESPVSA